MGGESPTSSLRLALRCDATAPRRARAAVSQALGSGPERDDAVLVTSELVTNAVQFSGCTSAKEVGLHVARHDNALCIAVHDPAQTAQAPQQREHDPARVDGHGLRIVAQLALRWGVETHADGRCVWVELPLPGADGDRPTQTRHRSASAPPARQQ
jgi:serine/threonine-protein kinase RsbW